MKRLVSLLIVLIYVTPAAALAKFGRFVEDPSKLLVTYADACDDQGTVFEVLPELQALPTTLANSKFQEIQFTERRNLILEALEKRLFNSAVKNGHAVAFTAESAIEATLLEHSQIDIIENVPQGFSLIDVGTLPCVQAIELDSILQLDMEEMVRPEKKSTGKEQQIELRNMTRAVYSPNDSLWNSLWHINDRNQYSIRAAETWDSYTGSVVASNPKVAVLDTGCSLHPDLIDQMYVKSDSQCSIQNVTQNPTQECFGWDFVDKDGNPFNEGQSVHGTPVSGAIAGRQNNGHTSAGVCWGCQIVCLRILNNEGSTLTSVILRSYEWLLANPTIKISNHSYGGYGPESVAMKTAIQKLMLQDHLFVAAAGNEACNIDERSEGALGLCADSSGRALGIMSPGGLDVDNILTVGSIDKDGEGSYFSNWGPRSVDLFAPGEDVTLIYNTRFLSKGYDSVSGTSFSAPIVAGSAALLWGASPNSNYSQIKSMLMNSVLKLPSLIGSSLTGGTLDLKEAYDIAGVVKTDTPRASETAKSDMTFSAYTDADGAWDIAPSFVQLALFFLFGFL